MFFAVYQLTKLIEPENSTWAPKAADKSPIDTIDNSGNSEIYLACAISIL